MLNVKWKARRALGFHSTFNIPQFNIQHFRSPRRSARPRPHARALNIRHSSLPLPCYHPPPMRRLALLFFFLIPLTANAWTRASDTRIAQRSLELAPPDLQLVLKRFEPEFEAGMQRAEGDEGSENHHYFVLSRQGKLRERIEQETRGTIAMIRGNQSMALVAQHLGVLAHLVADANN